MSLLPGFSSNQFLNRTHFENAATSLLRALLPYQSPGSARITLPLATGTHFDPIAAQLEGYARPLWAIGALQHSQSLSAIEQQELVLPFAQGLANGTDPSHAEYWGAVVVRDQRMVEMEIISFALLAAPDIMFHSQTRRAKDNITAWLKTINGKDFPATNWLWFRVLTNLALVKVCGVPRDEVWGFVEEDLGVMEGFYRGEGWAADGVWSDEGRQADYYSGSFAIQFSQLVYVKMAGDLDPERCERFQERARKFSKGFWRYFDGNGAAIPFGRSLTYRFALAGFWSAVAFAEVSLPAPLDDWGVIKGLLLRHFRWWSKKPDIFNCDGTLTIGFTYPNMYLSEDYNSPQSPYWAMKSFLALALPSHDPFWTAAEKPLPSLPSPSSTTLKLTPPMHILCNQPNHHFLLSTGQFCPWPLKATEAKYTKYAYSSHFGFSVPTGPIVPQLAPDSTLALSKDDGDTWRVPWKVCSPRFSSTQLFHKGEVVETLASLKSSWKPWKDADVLVSTQIIAPSKRWPDWYIRWHSIANNGAQSVQLSGVQGGFAIYGRAGGRGETLPCLTSTWDLSASNTPAYPEGTLTADDGTAALIMSSGGASGIRALRPSSSMMTSVLQEQAQVLKPDANTNLMWQRTLIPTVNVQVEVKRAQTVQFGCAVFALALTEERAERYTKELDIEKLWLDAPVVGSTGESGDDDEWCIRIA